MKEVGHFPMSENPAKFREYILPGAGEDLLSWGRATPVARS